MVKLSAFFVGLLCAATPIAHAEPPMWSGEATAESCAASFPERLADARQAVSAQQRYMAEHNRVMPWFEAHCRWLTDLEIAIRKINEPAAFVCDTQKGRPKGLTAQVAMEYNSAAGVEVFMEHTHSNDMCAPFDTAERVTLVLRDSPPVAVLEAMCFQVESEKCDKGRAALAAYRAKVATP